MSCVMFLPFVNLGQDDVDQKQANKRVKKWHRLSVRACDDENGLSIGNEYKQLWEWAALSAQPIIRYAQCRSDQWKAALVIGNWALDCGIWMTKKVNLFAFCKQNPTAKIPTVSSESEPEWEESWKIELESFPCHSSSSLARSGGHKRSNCHLGEEGRWDSLLGWSFIQRWYYDVVSLLCFLRTWNNCWFALGEGRGLEHHKLIKLSLNLKANVLILSLRSCLRLTSSSSPSPCLEDTVWVHLSGKT